MYSRSLCTGTAGQALKGGYVGIGLDEFGNYSNASAIASDDNGLKGLYPSAIVVRGDADGSNGVITGYITGTLSNLVGAFDSSLSGTSIGVTDSGNPPDATKYWRQVRFYLLPTSTTGYSGYSPKPKLSIFSEIS